MAQPLQIAQIISIEVDTSSTTYSNADTISFYVDGVYYGKYIASADAFAVDGTVPIVAGNVTIEIDNSIGGDFSLGDTLTVVTDISTSTLFLESVESDIFYLDSNFVFFENEALTILISSGLAIEESMTISEDAGDEILLGIDESIGIGEQVYLDAGNEISERINLVEAIDSSENTINLLEINDPIIVGEEFDDLEFEFAIIESPIIIGESYDTDTIDSINDEVTLSDSLDNPQLIIEETLGIEDAVFLDSEEFYYQITSSPFNLGNPGIKLLTEVVLYGLLDTTTPTYTKLYYKNYGATTFSETEWIPVNKTQASVFYIAATEFKIAVKSDAAFKPDTIKIKWKNVDNRYRRDFYVGSATPNSGR